MSAPGAIRPDGSTADQVHADARPRLIVRNHEARAGGVPRGEREADTHPLLDRSVPAPGVPVVHEARDPGGEARGPARGEKGLERPERRVERAGPVVVRPHAVARESHDGGVGPRAGDETPEDLIEGDVDVAERIADFACDARVVPLVPGIMVVPHLVADAVRLRENAEDEVVSSRR